MNNPIHAFYTTLGKFNALIWYMQGFVQNKCLDGTGTLGKADFIEWADFLQKIF